MPIHVKQVDITNVTVDAIVNPANSQGIMGAGTCGMIRRHGGESIQREAMSSAPIAVGAALVTGAGTLPAKKVIHAPIMERPGERIDAENVRRAVRAALIAASANGFDSIAIPAMGVDAGGVAVEEAARSIVEEIRAHKKELPTTVWLVDRDPTIVDAFEHARAVLAQS